MQYLPSSETPDQVTENCSAEAEFSLSDRHPQQVDTVSQVAIVIYLMHLSNLI